MKIPLDFNKEGNRLSVIATVNFSGRCIPVVFIVDTGSPETFVDEFTTSKFRILTKNLQLDHYMIMGGTKIALFKLGKVKINFKDINGNLASIDFSNLKVAETAWKRAGMIYSSISILGLDFLAETKLSLFVNPSKKEGYLTDEI
ncbi:MAG: hypothetical protein QXR09_00260 [Candidatus Aenigmatarchaeota archaeon]